MSYDPHKAKAQAEAHIDLSPQARAIGLEMVSVGPAEATVKAVYREELIGDPTTRVIAAGVITTLLDHACGQAVWQALDVMKSIATLDLRIDYMRAAQPGHDIVAHAHCYKLTRSVAFVRAQAYDRDPNDPIATAQAAFMLDSSAGRPSGANLPPEKRA